MKSDVNKTKDRAALAAAATFAFVCVGAAIYYIIFPSAAFFHSDCADTIYWAWASWESKSLFNGDFGYAAALPFGGTTLMTPLIGIFGVSMTTHHIGMVLFTLILFASAFALCENLKFSRSASFLAVGTLAAVLLASPKLREIFYEHVIYYSVCALSVCVLITLFIKYTRSHEKNDPPKKLALVCVGAAAFSVCVALDGVQLAAIGIFPVIFAVAAEAFLDADNKLFSRKNLISLKFCACCAVGAVLGLIIFHVAGEDALLGYAGAFSSYSDAGEWAENLIKLPSEWFRLFGADPKYGEPIFSLESAVTVIRLGTAVVVALVPLAALIAYKKLDFGPRILVLTHFGLSGVILFGYVFGTLSAANWRLSPMIFTGIPICFAAFLASKKNSAAFRVSAAALCVLLAASVVCLQTVAVMDVNGIEKNEKYLIARALDEKGLNYGFASFWNSQAITILSDARVVASNIDVDERGVTPCRYQTDKKRFEPNGADEYFVLLSEKEVEQLRATGDWKYFIDPSVKTTTVNGYFVYIFNNLDFLD